MRDKLGEHWTIFLDGDREAFGEIYRHYFGMLTMYCLGYLKRESIAQDTASEVLLKLFQLPGKSEIRNVQSWLFTAAKNLCLNRISVESNRSELLKNHVHQMDRVQHPDAEHQMQQETVDQMISKELDADEQSIWKLHESGFNNEEISAELSMSEKTVANKKSMVRQKLKNALRHAS